MKIEFNEEKHQYLMNGEIASISVTELLAKHKLAPSYRGVSKEKLQDAAKKGKQVHKDLENVLNGKDYEPVTQQGEYFKDWVHENLDCGVAEQLLGFNYKGLRIAGTADVMAIGKQGELIVGDHKNTSVFNREYVEWQVSIYDYFARKLGKTKINGRNLNWVGATKFYCFHYNPVTGELEVKQLNKVPDYELEKLIDAEYNGKIYKRRELVVDPELVLKVKQFEGLVNFLDKQKKQAEESAKELREQIKVLMEEQGIKSWKVGNLELTYVAEQCRLNVDSEKLKNNYPLAYSECQKMTIVKPFVKVKVNEDGSKS